MDKAYGRLHIKSKRINFTWCISVIQIHPALKSRLAINKLMRCAHKNAKQLNHLIIYYDSVSNHMFFWPKMNCSFNLYVMRHWPYKNETVGMTTKERYVQPRYYCFSCPGCIPGILRHLRWLIPYGLMLWRNYGPGQLLMETWQPRLQHLSAWSVQYEICWDAANE
jgi:hypothetical protein